MTGIKKIALSFALTGGLGAGVLVYYYRQPLLQLVHGPVVDFDEVRDTQPILELFRTDRYWLLSSDDYSPEYMLKYRAPNRNPFYTGKLRIKVLRDNAAFVGFVAYYKKTFKDGFLLFVAVKPELRGKHYAQTLMEYACADLKKMGATSVSLVTRTTNLRAQALYNRIGFTETAREDGYVYFKKTL